MLKKDLKLEFAFYQRGGGSYFNNRGSTIVPPVLLIVPPVLLIVPPALSIVPPVLPIVPHVLPIVPPVLPIVPPLIPLVPPVLPIVPHVLPTVPGPIVHPLIEGHLADMSQNLLPSPFIPQQKEMTLMALAISSISLIKPVYHFQIESC